MKLRVIVSIFFVSAIFCGFTQTASAKIKLTNKDKREIIKQILQETNFSDALEYVPDGTLFLSTENIPVKIQRNFPVIKGVKFQFITIEEINISAVKVKYFAFSGFKIRKNSVEILFSEVNLPVIHSLNFSCRKVKNKWKIRIISFFSEIT